jgi:DNA replication protein DnaC
MMKNESELTELVSALELKTPAGEIEAGPAVLEFLKAELQYRKQHRIQRLLRASGLRQVKTFEQFNWSFNPGISKEEIYTFLNAPWVETPMNLVLIGDTGLGKTHIASAFCYEAILKGHSTAKLTAFDLLSKIQRALNPAAKIEYYSRLRVLCVDELGYVYHKKEDADVLFQIISKRSESLPTIVTTNLAPKEWGSIFSSTAASAILDRLSYNGKFITFQGRSYRLLKKHKGK